MKSTHGYYPILSLLPWNVLLDFCTCSPHLLLDCWPFCLQFCSSVTKKQLLWVEIRWLTWWLKNVSLLCLETILGYFCSIFWVIIHLYCEALPYHFCSVWLNLSLMSTLEFIMLLPSAATSTENTSDPVSLAAIKLPPLCLVDDAFCFGLWAIPWLLYTFLFPSWS